jgi:2-aminoethylphosphonate dioxygenase
MPRANGDPQNHFLMRGYVVLPNFFSPSAAAQLRELSDQMTSKAASILYCAGYDNAALARRARDTAELIVVPESSHPDRVCRYEYMMGSQPCFARWVQEWVSDIVSVFAGESMTSFKDKTNEKLPGGGGFGPHQDFAAYRHFQPRRHVTALLSVDPATTMNGCLQFATNFHAMVSTHQSVVLEYVGGEPLLHFNTGNLHYGDIREDIAEHLVWAPVQLTPLDLVLFDSFVPHRSDCNNSNAPRRAIFITYCPGSDGSFYEQYYAEKRAHYDDPKFHVATPTRHRDTGLATL